MNKELHIVILAAGLSQRLGFAKQLIIKNGMTLLEEKIRLALGVTDKVLVVVPAIDTHWAQKIDDIARQFPIKIVPNPTPHTGMAQSIQLAFCRLHQQNLSATARVIFLTIDQVALTADHLAKLTQLAQLADSHTLIASRYQPYGETAIIGIPVNMPYGFLAEFAPQLQGDKGFGKMLNQLAKIPTDYQVLPLDIPELAWDIDTPDQFKRLAEKFALTLSPYQQANR